MVLIDAIAYLMTNKIQNLKDKLLTAYLIVTQDNNIMYCLV